MIFPPQSKYPKKVHLKGETYKLKFVKGLKDIGNTDSGSRTICIRSGMSRQETFRTFLHEILHFIEFEWPVKIKHKQVYQLEEAIFHFILDNFT